MLKLILLLPDPPIDYFTKILALLDAGFCRCSTERSFIFLRQVFIDEFFNENKTDIKMHGIHYVSYKKLHLNGNKTAAIFHKFY